MNTQSDDSIKTGSGARGWLRNGNLPGDFHKCARCGAKTRSGLPCKSPAMKNGRCRMHGGTSTGPSSKAGIERCRRANRRSGRYTQTRIQFRTFVQQTLKCARLSGEILKAKEMEARARNADEAQKRKCQTEEATKRGERLVAQILAQPGLLAFARKRARGFYGQYRLHCASFDFDLTPRDRHSPYPGRERSTSVFYLLGGCVELLGTILATVGFGNQYLQEPTESNVHSHSSAA